MYYYDELSVNQIAEIQGVTPGTVKSRLNYARKSIKAAVESYEDKNQIKLHSVGILPLLLWLFGQDSKSYFLPNASSVLAKATATAKASAPVAAANTASGVANAGANSAGVSTGAVKVGAASAKTGAKFLGTLSQKIIAGVVAASVTAGGVVAVVSMNDDSKKSQSGDKDPDQETVATESVGSSNSASTSQGFLGQDFDEVAIPKEPEVVVWYGKGGVDVGLNLSNENEFTIEMQEMADGTVQGNFYVNKPNGSYLERTFTGTRTDIDPEKTIFIYDVCYDIVLNEEVEKYLRDYPGYTKITLYYDKEEDVLYFAPLAPYDAKLTRQGK